MSTYSELPAAPVGLVGHQAHAAQRGFLYQAVVAAIEWIRLAPDEILWLERLEDVAVHSSDQTKVVQVKDRTQGTSLRTTLPFLERAAELLRLHPREQFAFALISTAPALREASPLDRIGDEPLLLYWNRVRGTADAVSIVPLLKHVAEPASALANFVASAPEDEVVDRLINAVVWATEQPRSLQLENEAAEALATFVKEEFGQPRYVGRGLIGAVIHEVTRRSSQPDEALRRLTKKDLLEKIKESFGHTLDPATIGALARAAAQVQAVPTQLLTDRLRSRLEQLQRARFFEELDPSTMAASLEADVMPGGSLELSNKDVRVEALAWCARILSNLSLDRARAALDAARTLGHSEQIEFVEALLQGRQDEVTALQLIAHHRGGAAQTIRFAIKRQQSDARAAEWVNAAALAPADFDPDGQFLVLNTLLLLRQWRAAHLWAQAVTDEAREKCLALGWSVAFSLLTQVVPDSQRSVITEGVPLFSQIDLSDRVEHKLTRRRAALIFRQFSRDALALGLRDRADTALEYALWIELEDASLADKARTEIADLCRLSTNSHQRPPFQWIPIALWAGVIGSAEAVLADVRKEYETFGALDQHAATALFSALIRIDAKNWIADWPTIEGWLSPYIRQQALALLYAEATAKLVGPDEAISYLEGAGLSEEERHAVADRVRRSLAIDDLASAEERLRGGALNERRELAVWMAREGRDGDAASLAEEIFHETQTTSDAEACAQFLFVARRFDRIVELFGSSPPLELSPKLFKFLARAYFELGKWEEAKNALGKSGDEFAETFGAKAELCIYGLDWESLKSLLAEAKKHIGSLEGKTLRQSARLASVLNEQVLCREFVSAAIERDPNDPATLFQGYLLATRGRWEHVSQAGAWLQAAIRHASPDGPVRSATLDDLAEMLPQRQKKFENLNNLILSGELFLALAGNVAHRPLSGILVDALEQNGRTDRPERRSILPLISGAHEGGHNLTREAFFDGTSLVVLQYLGLLKPAIDLFDKVHVAHETGLWLFHDFEQLAFHQPSRIQEAKELVVSVVNHGVGVVADGRTAEPRLAREVGSELASLIASAKEDIANGVTSVVVHPGPIHRATSLGKEIASLEESEESVIISTLAFLDSLRKVGGISNHSYESNRSALRLSDQGLPWDREVELKSTTVYLDSLAVVLLKGAGVLQKAQSAGIKLAIHSSALDEAKALLETEVTEGAAQDCVRGLRDQLRELYLEGRLTFGASIPSDEDGKDEGAVLALKQLFHVSGQDLLVVADDRAISRYDQLTSTSNEQHPVLSSLDLIEELVRLGRLSEGARNDALARLRSGGVVLIPINAEELFHAVTASQLVDGVLVESYEARAIRENVQLVQLSGVLQVQAEGKWLTRLGQSAREAIGMVWERSENDEATEARAEWLAELARLSNFSQCFLGGFDSERVLWMDAMTVAQLVSGCIARSNAVLQIYNAWLESNYLSPIRQRKPRLFKAVVETIKQQLLEIAREMPSRESGLNKDQARAGVAAQITGFPSSLRSALIDDEEFKAALGIESKQIVHVATDGSSSYEFVLDLLYGGARRVLSGEPSVNVADESGKLWLIRRDGEEIVADGGHGFPSIVVPQAVLLSPDSAERGRYMVQLYKASGGETSISPHWGEIAAERPLGTEELKDLHRDMEQTPASIQKRIREAFQAQSASVHDLVPFERNYFNRLIGPEQVGNVNELATIWRDASSSGDANDLSIALLRSSHPLLAPLALIKSLSASDIEAFIESELPHLDAWSLVGLIEGVVRRDDAFDRLASALGLVIRAIAEITAFEPRMALTVALCSMVDVRIMVSGYYYDDPVFRRRLMSFSHAGLIEREVLRQKVPIESFSAWAADSLPEFHCISLVDLRRDPRWSAIYWEPHQLGQELVGRVLNALEPHRSSVLATSWGADVFGPDPTSLEARREIIYSAMPGPLEGNESSAPPMPKEVEEYLAEQLSSLESPLQSICAAAHFSLMATPSADFFEAIIASARDLFSSTAPEGTPEWSRLLAELSASASANRQTELANLVIGSVVSSRHLPFATRLYTGLRCCATSSDEDEWSERIASFLRALSPGLTSEDAAGVLAVLDKMMEADPVLTPKISSELAKLKLRAGRLK